ncbi:DMT family transporter [Aquipuribacter hungaricus]|uniref:DMT family transporter n=1 Tax=Aquipuribacter hungaricus TaxID=545624 RepID=UPI0030EC54C2
MWGSSYLWIALALEAFSPLQVTAGRLVLGAGLLVAVVGAGRVRPLLADRSLLGPLVVAALLATVVPFTLFALAQQSIPSGRAGALNATTPLWTLAAALVTRYQRRTSAAQVAGLLVGLAGAVLVLAPWQDPAGTLVGSLLALAGAASYGVGYVHVAARLTSRGLPGTALAACQLLVATALLLPGVPWLLSRPVEVPDGAALPWGAVVALAVLGLGGTGAAYVLLYRLVRDDGPVVAAGVAYLLPVVALVLGALLLDEAIEPGALAGVVLVLGGVALTRRHGTG